MAVGDLLLGSAPSTKFAVKPTVTPEQAAAYSQLLQQLSPGSASGTPYQGNLGAGLSSLETTSLAGLEQMAMNAADPNSAYQQGTNALLGIINQGPEDINDYFTKNIEDPLIKDFNEKVLPGISRRFAPSGFYSSDRLRSDDLARRDLGDSLTRARSDVSYKAYQDNMQNKLAALGLLPQSASAAQAALQQALEAGATPREVEALNNQLKYEEFVRQQSQGDDRIKALIAALGIPQFENIGVSKGGSSGLLGGVASGIGSFLGGYFG